MQRIIVLMTHLETTCLYIYFTLRTRLENIDMEWRKRAEKQGEAKRAEEKDTK